MGFSSKASDASKQHVLEIRQKYSQMSAFQKVTSLCLPLSGVTTHSSSKSPFISARPREINAAGKMESEL
jgi:hypothetical protein